MSPSPVRSNVPGLLIVVEGIDGAGKSTQARRLAARLREQGHEVVADHEPTDGPWGRKLRESAVNGRMSLDDELQAFLEDRREHVRDVIGPALARGAVVLLDRYYFSTMAYQGVRGADTDAIRRDNEAFAPRPDLVLLVDFDPRIALQRIEHSRGDVPNTFERLDQLQAIRKIFLATAVGDETFRIIDGGGSPDEVAAAMEREVDGLLQRINSAK